MWHVWETYKGVELLSLTLRKKHKLWVFENGLLRKISGTKTEELTWEWRRLHEEEIYNLNSIKNTRIIQVLKSRMRWARHVARMGGMRGAYKDLVGRPERKSSRGRPRHRWENNTKIDL